MTNSIRAYLFDLGNVLVRFDHMTAAKKIAEGTGATPEGLYTLFFESPLVIQHDQGKISTQQFYEGVKKITGVTAHYDRFLEVWNDIFIEDKQMTSLVAGLLEKSPCYLISNTNRPHFEYLETQVLVLRKLNGRILSYEVGHLKPHPVIYQKALEMARLRPEEIFYVDDREDLIEAARSMGFQAHRFTGYETLLGELKQKGIRSSFDRACPEPAEGLGMNGNGQ